MGEDGKDRGREDSAFGVLAYRRADDCLAVAHVHIICILHRPPLSLRRGIHLISQELHHGSCLSVSHWPSSVSSGSFVPAHLRHHPAVSDLQKGQRPQRVRQGHRSLVCAPVNSPHYLYPRVLVASSSREARRYLDKHLRLDIALQSYMNNRENAQTPSSIELEKLFNIYKGLQFVLAEPVHVFLTPPLDRNDDDITVDGTLSLCSDLGVDPEDVVLLSVACELKSPSVGRWRKTNWIQGWRGLG